MTAKSPSYQKQILVLAGSQIYHSRTCLEWITICDEGWVSTFCGYLVCATVTQGSANSEYLLSPVAQFVLPVYVEKFQGFSIFQQKKFFFLYFRVAKSCSVGAPFKMSACSWKYLKYSHNSEQKFPNCTRSVCVVFFCHELGCMHRDVLAPIVLLILFLFLIILG